MIRQKLFFRPQLEALDGRVVPSTLHVTSSGDVGKGTLRYAIDHAHNRDTIDFAPGIRTISLHLNDLVITAKNLNIKGPGADQLTVTTDYFGDSAPYGYYGVRLFEVAAGSVATITGLTLTNGQGRANGLFSSGSNDGKGGAILNSGMLTVSSCVVDDNDGGYGGAIYNDGTLTLSGCTLKGDRAGISGGGIYNAGTATVTASMLSFDSVYYPPAYVGSGIYNTGTLTVGTSTFVWCDIAGPYVDAGGNQFITDRPVIGSYTATPDPVTAGGSVTLAASSITDSNPGGSITQVMIYFDGVGGTPYGYATQTSPGVWTFTFSTAGWAPGTHTFSAVAVDSYGVSSLPVDVTVQVI